MRSISAALLLCIMSLFGEQSSNPLVNQNSPTTENKVAEITPILPFSQLAKSEKTFVAVLATAIATSFGYIGYKIYKNRQENQRIAQLADHEFLVEAAAAYDHFYEKFYEELTILSANLSKEETAEALTKSIKNNYYSFKRFNDILTGSINCITRWHSACMLKNLCDQSEFGIQWTTLKNQLITLNTIIKELDAYKQETFFQ